MLFLFAQPAWASDPARLAGFSPAIWAKLDPTPKTTSNIVGFLVYLIYDLYFLYYGNTNLVLKYSVFHEMLHIYIYVCVCVCVCVCVKNKKKILICYIRSIP